MRIRLTLSINVTSDREWLAHRERQAAAEVPPHDVVEGGAYIERRPEPDRIGFRPSEEDTSCRP